MSCAESLTLCCESVVSGATSDVAIVSALDSGAIDRLSIGKLVQYDCGRNTDGEAVVDG